MSLLITSIDAKGSAVAQVTKSLFPNQGVPISGTNINIPSSGATTPANKLFLLLDAASSQAAFQCSMKIDVKGPGNYKFKGHIDSSPLSSLSTSALANDLGSDVLPEELYATGGVYEALIDVCPFGDVSASGTYNVKISVKGVMPLLTMWFQDTNGTVALFTFSGFSHGEAEINLVKA